MRETRESAFLFQETTLFMLSFECAKVLLPLAQSETDAVLTMTHAAHVSPRPVLGSAVNERVAKLATADIALRWGRSCPSDYPLFSNGRH